VGGWVWNYCSPSLKGRGSNVPPTVSPQRQPYPGEGQDLGEGEIPCDCTGIDEPVAPDRQQDRTRRRNTDDPGNAPHHNQRQHAVQHRKQAHTEQAGPGNPAPGRHGPEIQRRVHIGGAQRSSDLGQAGMAGEYGARLPDSEDTRRPGRARRPGGQQHCIALVVFRAAECRRGQQHAGTDQHRCRHAPRDLFTVHGHDLGRTLSGRRLT